MNLNGKPHQINWMSYEGRDELMGLLKKDYKEHINCTSYEHDDLK